LWRTWSIGLGAGVEHRPGDDPGEEDAVVAAGQLGGDLGVEEGQGVGQDGPALRVAAQRQAVEGGRVGGEAAGEVLDQPLVAGPDLVQGEPAGGRDPVGHVAVVPQGHRQHRRQEARLLHPAGEHARGVVAPAGRQDEQAAGDPAQGEAQRGGLRDGSTPPSSGGSGAGGDDLPYPDRTRPPSPHPPRAGIAPHPVLV
jgi:hypothetical protein